jgi:hypothetical protein
VERHAGDAAGAGLTGEREDRLDLLRSIVDAGDQRRDQHPGRDPRLHELGDGLQALAGMRGVRLGLPPGVLVQGGHREVCDEVRTRDQFPHELLVSQQERRLGQDRAGVAEVAHRLPDPLHQAIAALDPLVGIGVRPEGDVVALPGGTAQLGPHELRHVHLDDDLALEVLACVQVEVGMRGAGEAVDPGKTHAWVHPR